MTESSSVNAIYYKISKFPKKRYRQRKVPLPSSGQNL
jgi:hypothetical protein